jgi:amino acid adenylation domain-containing protein
MPLHVPNRNPLLSDTMIDAPTPLAWAHEFIAHQAAVRPAALAVRDEKRQLTFHELDQRANRLARHMQTLGVDAEVAVGLYLERSVDFVVAALAVLKAGGGYVPLDPAHPGERIGAILTDAEVRVLLSHRRMAAALSSGPWKIVDLDSEAASIENHAADPLLQQVDGNELAYIIYTSGSTGRPKGVEVTHANLAHLIGWYRAASAVNPNDRASQMFGFAFDAAVLETWGHLTAGASVHLVDEVSRRSPEGLRDWLVAEKITIGFAPAVIAEHLVVFDWPEQTALRLLVTGGDTLHRYAKAGLPFRVENQYGPTECTVVVTSGVVRSGGIEGELPSIGRPIDDTEVLILDAELKRLPTGEEGEICVAGPQLARRYRNLPEMTAEKFVVETGTGRRLYRTGDRGRVLPNGEIAFLGRMDDLIKIRGFRVEPDEIISHLISHPGIRNSTVVAQGDNANEKILVAYLVPADGAELTAAELRGYLRARVPDYMIPASYVSLSSLPVTITGKCDKRSLPAPSAANLLPESRNAPSADQTCPGISETRVAELVKGLLGGRTISRDDDFFLTGGHSMLGAQLLTRLRESLGVQLTLRQLFQAPTIASLAEIIDQKLVARK